MDVKVKLSGLKVCMRCGSQIRIKYMGDETYLVQPDPIDDIPINPIHELHAKYCVEDMFSKKDDE